MSQAFLASEGTLIGTMDASGNFQLVVDVSTLPPDVRNIVESYHKKNTQRQTVMLPHSSDHLRTQLT
jgi:hypothetical protein